MPNPIDTSQFADLYKQNLGQGYEYSNYLNAKYGNLTAQQARDMALGAEQENGKDFWIEAQDIEKLKDVAPNVYRWAQDPIMQKAIASRQNLKMLENVEQSNWAAIPKTFWYSSLDIASSLLGFGDAALDSQARQKIDALRPELDSMAEQVGRSINYDEFKNESREGVLRKMAKSDYLKTKYIKADTEMGQIGLDVVRQGPQLILQGIASRIGGNVGGGAAMFAMIAGEQYQKLIDEGVDPDRALQAATMNAAVQAIIEQFSYNFIWNRVRAKSGKAIAAKELVKDTGSEFATEFIQQFPEVIAEYWAKNSGASPADIGKMMWDNRKEILKEAGYSGLIGGIMGGLMGGIKVSMAKKAHDAQIKQFKATQQEYANSELFKKAPDIATMAVNQAEGQSSVYVDPDALMSYQQSDPDIFTKLGIDEQTVIEKQNKNELVELDKGNFRTENARSNETLFSALENDIAFEEDGYTYNQLNAKSAEDIINSQKEAQSESRAMNAELGKMKEQFLAAGLDEKQAQSFTVIFAKMATQLSEGSGLPVSQWIKENAPQFARTETQFGGAYNQDGIVATTLGAENLKLDMETWSREVDSFLLDSKANKNPAKVATTPLVLTLAGADIKPIYMDKSIMRKILLEKHSQGMTPEVVKQIPQAITDPLFIYQAQDKDGKKVLVSVLGLKDANGDYVIAPLILDAQAGRYVANKLQTSYGKEAILKPNSKWAENILNSQDLRYINKKETTSWLATLGLQLPTVTSQYSGLSDTSIPNENDLVKRKLLYPELYQGNTLSRGSVSWDEQGRAIIKLFEHGDVSTVIHEMLGHWTTQILIESPNNPNAPQWMLDGRKTILEFTGHTEESFAKVLADHNAGNHAAMIELHEKMARAAEAYMMEGKAPTKELKNVFQRFKKWMSEIYKSMKELNVEITPEIRQLFDRVLTSQQEIQEARAVEGWNEKLPPEMYEGLSDNRIANLEKFRESAKAKAEETLLKKLTSFISQDNKIAMQERRIALTDEIMQDVSQEQTYIASNSIMAEFKNHYKTAKEVAAKYSSGKLTEDQAVHFDVLAEFHGYESGAEMAHDITNSPTAEKMVQGLVDMKMKQEFKDIYGNKSAMEQEARQALYNDEGALVNAIEAQMIRDKVDTLKKGQQSADERWQEQKIMTERARITAWSDLNNMPIKDAMKTSVYITAERRAHGKVMAALAKGDFETALKHKEAQMYNHAMVQGSIEMKRQYESFNRYMEKQRKVDKKTFVNEDNFAQAADIMLKYGYVRTDYSPKMKVQSLSDYAKNINENGLGTMAIAEWLYAENAAFDHKQLTMRELKDVQNAIKNIKVYARQANQLTRIANGQKLDDLVQDMAVSLMGNKDLPEGKRYFEAQQKKDSEISNKEKLGELFRRAHYANVKFADFVLALDDYHDFGLFYNTLYKPLYEGQNSLSRLTNEFVDKEKSLIEKMYPDKESRKALDQKVYYKELGTTVDKRYLIEMASHLGSDSNRNVLFGQRPVGDDLAKSTLWVDGDKEQTGKNILAFLQKHLTAADWRYVQGSWENVSFLFPLAQEVHKRQTGFYMEQVQKVPFIVKSADGEQIVMKGGYYPLKEDYRASQRAEQNEQKPLYTEGFAMWMPTTNKGYTNSRTGATYSIDLRNTNRYKHIQSVAHDIAFREIIGDMRKLLNNKEFRELIIRKTGKRGEDLIREMVATAAVNRNARTEMGESMMNDFSSYMRKQTVLALLMGNLKTLTQNFANIALYGNAVKGFSHADAIGSLVRYGQFDMYTGFQGFREMVSEVSEKSAFMKDRESAPDFSLNQFTENEESKWIKWGGMMLAATDNMTAVPIWKGAYEKALSMGKTEADAILFADTIIDRSIGSGRAIDAASIFRGSPLMKTLTALGSFMNTRYNEWARMYGIVQRDGLLNMQVTSFVFSRILVFKALETLLVAGWPKDDEDKEKWAKQWATEAILFQLSTPVGGGATTQAISALINDSMYQFRPSPVITIGEKLYKLAATGKGFAEGKKSGAELAEAATGAFAFTGVPVLNTPAPMLTKGFPDILNKWFWNAYDIYNGMQPEFQDLFKRRPKRER